MSLFPYPVLGEYNSYPDDVKFYHEIQSKFKSDGSLQLTVYHKLLNCTFLGELIANNEAHFSIEVRRVDRHLNYFNSISSGPEFEQELVIPSHELISQRFSVTSRIVSIRKQNFEFREASDDLRGVYPIMPGSVLAIDESIIEISSNLDQFVEIVSGGSGFEVNLDEELIQVFLDSKTFQIYRDLPEQLRKSRIDNIIEMIAVVEAVSCLKFDSQLDDKLWFVRLNERFKDVSLNIEELHSIAHAVECALGAPIAKLITELNTEMVENEGE